jgi:hypothetical protein
MSQRGLRELGENVHLYAQFKAKYPLSQTERWYVDYTDLACVHCFRTENLNKNDWNYSKSGFIM